MAYSELIKDIARIRGYMREFFAYGFKGRGDVGAKSARSYDNERRRIESWLGDCMAFRQDAAGKAVFLSVDSRRMPRNPLYKAWKAASFTRNDISLHFILLDILADGRPRSLSELLETIDGEYLSSFEYPEPIDESTLRKKLKEYTDEGLIVTGRQGKQYLYMLSTDAVDLERWRDAVAFFSETSPLGVIGSFILDKYRDPEPARLSFKHRYLLFALDNGILIDLLEAIHSRRKVELELAAGRDGGRRTAVAVPLRIFISTQGGRQYAAVYTRRNKIAFFRLDAVTRVKALGIEPDYEARLALLEKEQPHIWGVSRGRSGTGHIEMKLTVDPKDAHIIHRLEREKRCGEVARISETEWVFSADVYDAWELIPWLRTFIGRISSLTCSDRRVERQFWEDCAALSEMYGGGSDAFQ